LFLSPDTNAPGCIVGSESKTGSKLIRTSLENYLVAANSVAPPGTNEGQKESAANVSKSLLNSPRSRGTQGGFRSSQNISLGRA
jgi:hypothetical protein